MSQSEESDLFLMLAVRASLCFGEIWDAGQTCAPDIIFSLQCEIARDGTD